MATYLEEILQEFNDLILSIDVLKNPTHFKGFDCIEIPEWDVTLSYELGTKIFFQGRIYILRECTDFRTGLSSSRWVGVAQ